MTQAAPPTTDTGPSGDALYPKTFRVCVVSLGTAQYAVDLRNVREVVPVDSITPVPGMPSILVGLTNVRGAVVPIVDLRMMVKLPQPEANATFAVVLRHEEYQLAILVDRSPEILSVLPDQIMQVMQENTESVWMAPFLSGVLKIEEHSIPMLDIAMLVEFVDTEAIARDIE